MSRTRWAATLAGFLLLAGCASTGQVSTAVPAAEAPSTTLAATANPAQQALYGYLALANNGVVFIQWTEANGALSGTLTEAFTSFDPANLKHSSSPFTGVLSAGSVTLTFPQGFGTSTSWNGTLSGDSLILSYSADDGSLSTLTFHPGTVADYNAAVAEAQAAAAAAGAEQDAAASAAAAQQAAEAQRAAAQQRLDNAVRSASSDVTTALGQLTSNVDSVESNVSDMTQDATSADGALANVRGALARVQSAAAVTPMDDYQQSSVCYEVSGVDYEVGGITYYTDPVRNNGDLATQTAAAARGAAGDATTAISALERAIAADPSGVSPDVSPGSARATIKDQLARLDALETKASKALKSAAASDSTAASLLTQAKQVATSVGASC